jgi:hypothetical protein
MKGRLIARVLFDKRHEFWGNKGRTACVEIIDVHPLVDERCSAIVVFVILRNSQ